MQLFELSESARKVANDAYGDRTDTVYVPVAIWIDACNALGADTNVVENRLLITLNNHIIEAEIVDGQIATFRRNKAIVNDGGSLRVQLTAVNRTDPSATESSVERLSTTASHVSIVLKISSIIGFSMEEETIPLAQKLCRKSRAPQDKDSPPPCCLITIEERRQFSKEHGIARAVPHRPQVDVAIL